MTSPDATTVAPQDDPAELDRFLDAYCPKEVWAAVWLSIAPAATSLVKRSGELTRLRVEKDIHAVGAVVAQLVKWGRPVTLAEVLSDGVPDEPQALTAAKSIGGAIGGAIASTAGSVGGSVGGLFNRKKRGERRLAR